MAVNPNRLFQELLNTGLQNKDERLYQLLRDMIKATTALAGGGGSVVNNQTFINTGQPILLTDDYPDDGLTIPGPIGATGATGATGPAGASGSAGSAGPPGLSEDGIDSQDIWFPPGVTAAGTTATPGSPNKSVQYNEAGAFHGVPIPAADPYYLKQSSTGTSPVFSPVTMSDLTADATTNNDVNSTDHGFAPVSPGDATKFLNGGATPGWTDPFGSSTIGIYDNSFSAATVSGWFATPQTLVNGITNSLIMPFYWAAMFTKNNQSWGTGQSLQLMWTGSTKGTIINDLTPTWNTATVFSQVCKAGPISSALRADSLGFSIGDPLKITTSASLGAVGTFAFTAGLRIRILYTVITF